MTDRSEYKGYTITLRQDDDGGDPRDADNLGVMLCQHSRYTLGDETALGGAKSYLGNAADYEVAKRAFDYYAEGERGGLRAFVLYLKTYLGATVVLPLGLHDHSGISMYVGGGAHPHDPGGWDSGTVGFIFDTAASRKTTGCTEGIADILRAEVAEYDLYLTGEVYGYTITDPDGDDVDDSCWGILGDDTALQMARDGVDDDITYRLNHPKHASPSRVLTLLNVEDAAKVLNRPVLQSEVDTLRDALTEHLLPVFERIVTNTLKETA